MPPGALHATVSNPFTLKKKAAQRLKALSSWMAAHTWGPLPGTRQSCLQFMYLSFKSKRSGRMLAVPCSWPLGASVDLNQFLMTCSEVFSAGLRYVWLQALDLFSNICWIVIVIVRSRGSLRLWPHWDHCLGFQRYPRDLLLGCLFSCLFVCLSASPIKWIMNHFIYINTLV